MFVKINILKKILQTTYSSTLPKKPFIWKRRTLNGAGNEIRTRDSKLGKLALYQLSYARLPNVAVYDSLWLMSIVFEAPVAF